MADHPSIPPASRSNTVLVVDDDPAVLLLCRKKLEADGYTVFQATGSSEALKLFAEHPRTIQLLLVDVLLPPPGFQLSVENNPFPRVNGLELMDRILLSGEVLRAVLMSASPKPELLAGGMLRAELPFLQKPFTTETLGALIREVMSGPPVTINPGKTATSHQKDVEWFG